MKFLTLISRRGILVLSGLLAAAVLHGDDTVPNPTIRKEALELAKSLLAAHNPAPVTADPFHPEAFAQLITGANRPPTPDTPTTAAPAGPKSDKELLQAIAASLKPSGFFVLGGQPTLVFGQKRVKAGGFITITFEGTEYNLEVISLDRTNFTLRLNREELTRPIK